MTSDAAKRKAPRAAVTATTVRVLIAIGLSIAGFSWVWWRTITHTPLLAAPPDRITRNKAHDLYCEAKRLIKNESAVTNALMRTRTGFRTSPQQWRQILNQNAEALAVLREGLKLDYDQPALKDTRDQSNFDQFNVLERLLALQTHDCAAQGDWPAVEAASLDQITFDESLIRGGGVDSAQVWTMYRTRGGRSALDAIDHLNAAQLRSAADRILNVIARRPSFESILNEEKWLQLRARDELLSNPNWREAMANGNALGMGAQTRIVQMGQMVRWMGVDKRRIMLDYCQYIDQCISLAHNSSGAAPIYPVPPPDPINQQLGVDLTVAHQRFREMGSNDTQLLLRISLRRFYLDHGFYPPTLQELCPVYLDRVPEDPLAKSRTFVYKRKVGYYILTAASDSVLRPGLQSVSQ